MKHSFLSPIDYYLTAGQLRELLAKVPADTPVYYERIEDVYFTDHAWKTKAVPDPEYPETGSQYIRAFSSTYKDKSLYITAHY